MYTERSITCYTFPVLCIYISIFIMKRLAYVSIYITLHTLRKYFFNFTITDVLRCRGVVEAKALFRD